MGYCCVHEETLILVDAGTSCTFSRSVYSSAARRDGHDGAIRACADGVGRMPTVSLGSHLRDVI